MIELSWQIWAVVAVVGFVLELTSGDFFIVSFAVGALAAAVAAPVAGVYVQLAVFVAVTALSLLLLRPAALKWMHKGEDKRKDIMEALIGRVGRVTKEISPNGYGRVAIDGDDWKARAADSKATFPEGSLVKVVERESIIITVVAADAD